MNNKENIDRVEAVAKKLWEFHIDRARLSDHSIPAFTEDDFREQKLIDHDSFERDAREILKLSVPELTESLWGEAHKCPGHRVIGGTHYCGIGTEGDLICWKAYKRNCGW